MMDGGTNVSVCRLKPRECCCWWRVKGEKADRKKAPFLPEHILIELSIKYFIWI